MDSRKRKKISREKIREKEKERPGEGGRREW